MNTYSKKRLLTLLCLLVFLLASLSAAVCIAFAADNNKNAAEGKTEASLNAWSVGSGKSDVYYGEKTKSYRVSPFDSASEMGDVTLKGLHVSLAPNDTFTYNQVINLNALDEETPIFNIGVMPDDGKRDVRFVYFTLKDAYDPSNSMTIQLSTGITDPTMLSAPNSWTIFSYLMAKTNNQTFAGTAGDEPTFGTNGHIYGTISKFGLYGRRSEYKVGKEYLALYYDVTEKALYVQSLAGKLIICDFDDADYFSVPFNGFTTGEVILSMYATTYYNDSFDMYFREIGGESAFSETLTDYVAPRLKVELPQTLPEGLVGYGYPVFNATAQDPYGDSVDLKTQVYFGYESELCYNVSVKNAKFIPRNEGIYTVVYTAKNVFGEVAVQSYSVEVKPADYSMLTIGEIDDVGVLVGHKVTLAKPVISGGVGGTDYTVSVNLSGEEIEIDRGFFVPAKAGRYTVTYTAEDYFGRTAQTSYTVMAAVSETPVIDEAAIVLPKYFIKGQTYTLPEVKAYDYADGGKVHTTLVDAVGGTLSGLRFTPADKIATISYIAVKGQKSTYVSRTIPVIDVTDGNIGLDIAKYFHTKNITSVKSASSIVFSNTVSAAESSAEFINKFVAEDFTFTAGIPVSAAVGAAVTVSLIDSLTQNESIELLLERTFSGIRVSYCGETVGEYKSGVNLRFYYNAADNTMTVNNLDTVLLKGFEGFSSEYLYFGFSFASGRNAEFSLSMLYGQGINNLTIDIGEPVIVSSEAYVHDRKYGEKVTVCTAIYADALDPTLTATVTVYTPSGKVAKDINGNTLESVSADTEYTFAVDAYGYWYIQYTAHSENGNGSVRYPLLVVDDIAPTIELSAAIPASVAFETSLILPNATVSDNVDAAEDMSCLCLVEHVVSHRVYVYAPGSRVAFEKQGTYRITYIVSDSVGNTSKLIYEISVE